MKIWNSEYKTLDHWRGLAALWVMLFHGFATTYDKALHPVVEPIKLIAANGWLGVHILFDVTSSWMVGCNHNQLHILSIN